MTGKGGEERKKVGNPWGNKWRWTKEVPGKAPREPVLWSSDQGIEGQVGCEVCGIHSTLQMSEGAFSAAVASSRDFIVIFTRSEDFHLNPSIWSHGNMGETH